MRPWPATGWGHGPVRAVLLHGFTGRKESFDHLASRLGAALTVTAVDLPGHGDAPAPGETVSFVDVVDTLAAQLDGASVLVGYSQGARLALGVAVRHPHLVRRLVLESGTPGPSTEQERATRRAEDLALAADIVAGGVEAFVDRWERHPLFSSLTRLGAAERAGLRARRLSHSAAGLAAALTTLGQGAQPEYWSALRGVTAPTLLLTGGLDAKYTDIARRMAAALPAATHVIFPGIGHAPHLECPDAYAAEVARFVASRRAGVAAEASR